jgi:hypothetical protein
MPQARRSAPVPIQIVICPSTTLAPRERCYIIFGSGSAEIGEWNARKRRRRRLWPSYCPPPLACCRWELERRHMTRPSNFALRIIVEEDSKLVRTLNAEYADTAPDGGLDTVERDALFNVLGLHFTGSL